jgi:hypothetical protein
MEGAVELIGEGGEALRAPGEAVDGGALLDEEAGGGAADPGAGAADQGATPSEGGGWIEGHGRCL